jgi:hypothetical protein
MPNGHNGQRNGAGDASTDHFAHSHRHIENNEVPLDTIAESLLQHWRGRNIIKPGDPANAAVARIPVPPRVRLSGGLTETRITYTVFQEGV